jgi:glycosyltransferase involved in cell wall biosynthesis
MSTSHLAIIVPAYNPPKGWSQALVQQWNALSPFLYNIKVTLVLVNDGSVKPEFEEEVEQIEALLPFTIVHRFDSNQGKGAALRKGMSSITADYYLLTDIDFPYTTDSMLFIFTELIKPKGSDISAGNRSAAYYEKVPGFRAVLSRSLRSLIRRRLKLPFDDTQCGLKAMNEKGKQVFLSTKTNRYLYDLEFIVKASSNPSLKIKPVAVELRDGIVMRRMSPRILFQEASNFLKIILFRHRL